MLFEPISIGKMKCKNRLAFAPMAIAAGYVNPGGSLSERAVDYFTERAKGGVGLIIIGATSIERDMERLSDIPFISPLSYPSFSELADAVHFYGAKVFVQMSPGLGRALSGEMIDAGHIPISASDVPSFWRPNTKTRELSTDEVEKFLDAFARATKLMVNAGIDGVEVHGHGGYLIDQFMSAMWNKRTDKYGGDLKGRLTFPIEILKRIKDVAGSDFPVTIRYSLKHYMKGPAPYTGALPGELFKEEGRDIPEGLEIAKILKKAGYDGLHIDAGCWESRYWVNVPLYHPHGCMIDMAEHTKKVVKIPVIGVGRINPPELAEQYLVEGKADMIALGRPLLADPYWPLKAKSGKVEDIRPCTGCHDGCRYRMAQGKPISCAVNPAVGRERQYELHPAAVQKKIVVVGGGVGGMETARIAAERGHKVVLFEKSQKLGGHLIEACVPDFKIDYKTLLEWFRTQISKSNVEIKMGTKATPNLIKKEKPDAVIVATGSTPIMPDIPGANKIALSATDLLLGKCKCGDSVVVAGGGLVGCEAALWLAKQGKEVTILEMLPDVATGILYANRVMLLDLLAYNKVKIMANTTLVSTEHGKAVIKKKSGESEIPCDSLVLAVGLKSDDQLYYSLLPDIGEIYMIGDCKEPRRIQDAIWDGHNIARTI